MCHWSSLYFLRLRRLTFLFPPSSTSSMWPSETLRDMKARCWPAAWSSKPSEELILTDREMWGLQRARHKQWFNWRQQSLRFSNGKKKWQWHEHRAERAGQGVVSLVAVCGATEVGGSDLLIRGPALTGLPGVTAPGTGWLLVFPLLSDKNKVYEVWHTTEELICFF